MYVWMQPLLLFRSEELCKCRWNERSLLYNVKCRVLQAPSRGSFSFLFCTLHGTLNPLEFLVSQTFLSNHFFPTSIRSFFILFFHKFCGQVNKVSKERNFRKKWRLAIVYQLRSLACATFTRGHTFFPCNRYTILLKFTHSTISRFYSDLSLSRLLLDPQNGVSSVLIVFQIHFTYI